MEFPKFNKKEETALWQRMKDGDEEAKDLLAKSQLRWAYKVALRHGCRDFDHEECESLAHFGLFQAMEHWKPWKGRLGTITQYWVRQVVMRQAQEQRSIIRVPCYHVRNFDPETDTRTENQKAYAKQANHVRNTTISLNTPISADEFGYTLQDTIASGQETVLDRLAEDEESDVLMALYNAALAAMDTRDSEILRLRLETDMTLKAIGERFSITRERVRQIEDRARKQLYKHLSRGRQDGTPDDHGGDDHRPPGPGRAGNGSP